MNEFDIDQIKEAWKNQVPNYQYSSEEIISILSKRSKNNVKYIFWISVAEFLLFTLFSLFNIWEDETLVWFLEILHNFNIQNIDGIQEQFKNLNLILKITSSLVTGYFVWTFFRKYQAINIQNDLKKFIHQLLDFRNTVNRFIIANVLLAFLFIFYFYYIIYIQIPEEHEKWIKMYRFLYSSLFSAAFTIIIVWGYYRLIYGIFLRKLNKNLKQINELDNNE